MDRRIKIDLSVVEATNLEDFLLATMEKIAQRAEEKGYYNTTEKRFIELSEIIGIQTAITDDEREYTSLVNKADDSQYRDQRLN
jgi:GGDEF domain-containing protein